MAAGLTTTLSTTALLLLRRTGAAAGLASPDTCTRATTSARSLSVTSAVSPSAVASTDSVRHAPAGSGGSAVVDERTVPSRSTWAVSRPPLGSSVTLTAGSRPSSTRSGSVPRWSRRTWSGPAGADVVVEAVPWTSAVSPVTGSAGPTARPVKPPADGSVGVIPSPDARVGAGWGVSDGPAPARVRGHPSTQSRRSSSMGRRLIPKGAVSHGLVRSIAW